MKVLLGYVSRSINKCKINYRNKRRINEYITISDKLGKNEKSVFEGQKDNLARIAERNNCYFNIRPSEQNSENIAEIGIGQKASVLYKTPEGHLLGTATHIIEEDSVQVKHSEEISNFFESLKNNVQNLIAKDKKWGYKVETRIKTPPEPQVKPNIAIA